MKRRRSRADSGAWWSPSPHGVSVSQVMEEIEALANPKSVSKKEVSQEQRRMKQFILDQVESVRDESDRKSKLRLVIEPRARARTRTSSWRR